LLLVWILDRPTGIGGTSLILSDIFSWSWSNSVESEVVKKESECLVWLKDDVLGDKNSAPALKSLIYTPKNK
jgi:hypothetical protein